MCEGPESCGEFLLIVLGFAGWWIDDGDAILETNLSHHLGQKPEAAQLAPTLFRRQRQLEHQAQQGIAGHAVLGPNRTVADCGKGGFDRVGGANMQPVLGRKVVKGQQGSAILQQFFHGLGVLGAEIPRKPVKRLFCLDLSLRHPDIMETRLGLGLNGFGHFVEDVGRLMYPTPLAAGLRPRLVQRGPEPQGAIADAQCRRRF